jgi:hypothetical protein
LRERVVRCIFRITSSWLAGVPVWIERLGFIERIRRKERR